jgi:hypothetical protein
VHGNYHGPAEGIASSASEKPVWGTKRPVPRWLIRLFTLRAYPARAIPSFIGAACDPFQRSWPVYPSSRDQRLGQRLGPTVVFSSSPTRPTAMASTSAWPRARNAAPTPPIPIASRGISPRLPPTAASTRMKSPARFPRPARAAAMPVAMNTSPLPASARLAIPANPATQAPRKRRDAAPRSRYEAGLRPVFRSPRQVAAPSETNFGDDKGFG